MQTFIIKIRSMINQILIGNNFEINIIFNTNLNQNMIK
jgi:hypothetical protein